MGKIKKVFPRTYSTSRHTKVFVYKDGHELEAHIGPTIKLAKPKKNNE